MAMRRLAPAEGLLSYFVRHRTAANLLLVTLIALGVAAAPRMRAQFFPDVVTDSISVEAVWEGAGAENVDAGIVAVLEPALLAVDGVDEARATSSEGRAQIRLEFAPGQDMGRATEDVQAAIDAARDLPDGAEDVTVRRGGWSDRVTDVVITGPVGVEQLGRFADAFVQRLFQAGVTRATIQGVAAPQTVVEVPSLALIRYDVTMAEIAAAIAAEADSAPAGEVAGTARVRTGSASRSAAEVAAVVLRALPDGSDLRVGDVARVRVEGADRARAYYVGDDPAVTISVDRAATGDAIDIQRDVERVAEAIRADLPSGVTVELIRTRAEMISGRLEILLDNALTGLALVVALLFLFLNARTAFWVAAGIPVAMTAAIAVMYAAGLTLNMISLFALIITLGIVVDDAIVVGEHADWRARVLGEPPVVAAENAARRMFAPVFSATLTTVIAFFALVAIGGRFGGLIADIPLTVIAVLTASLVECFLILPHHMARALAHSAREHWYDWPSRQVNRGFGWVRERAFRPAIRIVVAWRYPVMAAAVALLASQAALFLKGDVQWRFFNSPEEGSVTGNFAMAPGATRDDTLAMVANLQRAVADLSARYTAAHGRDPVDYAIAEIGGSAGRGLSGADTIEPDLLGAISVELIDADLRPYSSFAFVEDLQDVVVRHPELAEISFRRWGSGPGGDALSVQIYGADSPTLKAAAEALKARLAVLPGVSALEDTLAYDKDELILDLTAQGRALGLTTDALGRVLRDRLNGIEAASYPDGARSATIRVELPAGEITADFLDRAQVRTAAGAYVPLADVVTVTRREGFSTVRRENGQRVVTVTGDISEDDPDRAAAVSALLAADLLPAIEAEFGVATTLSGLAEQERDFLSDALTGFLLCLTGIYLVLAWIFSSWTRPMVVMAIIPFGLIGAIYGHWLWDVPLSMFSVVGLIGMTGIIINDSIVLVTTIDEHAQTRGIGPAIVEGTCDRLRPVLLTTLTTVLGLTPLLYETSQQAQFLKPTVITLVYGLGFGMGLVLLIVPALMAAQSDIARRTLALRRGLRLRRRDAGTVVGAGFGAWARAGVRREGRAPAWDAVLPAAAFAAAVWFVATLGWRLATGALPGPLGVLPTAAGALVLFVGGVAVLCAVLYAAALALRRLR